MRHPAFSAEVRQKAYVLEGPRLVQRLAQPPALPCNRLSSADSPIAAKLSEVKTELERVGEHVYFRTLVRFGDVLNCVSLSVVKELFFEREFRRERAVSTIFFLSFFRE